MKELILGGVRSGKTRFAAQRALAGPRPVTYIAIALAYLASTCMYVMLAACVHLVAVQAGRTARGAHG